LKKKSQEVVGEVAQGLGPELKHSQENKNGKKNIGQILHSM
jgi:hypothetical protein